MKEFIQECYLKLLINVYNLYLLWIGFTFYVVRNFRSLQVSPEGHLSAHFMEGLESFMYRSTFYISLLKESLPLGEKIAHGTIPSHKANSYQR